MQHVIVKISDLSKYSHMTDRPSQAASSNVFKTTYFALQTTSIPPCKARECCSICHRATPPRVISIPTGCLAQWGAELRSMANLMSRQEKREPHQLHKRLTTSPESLKFFNLLTVNPKFISQAKNPNSKYRPWSRSLLCTESYNKLHPFC